MKMWHSIVYNSNFLSYPKLIINRQLHLLRQQAFVNGDWISAHNNKVFNVVNPSNGAVITSVPDMNIDDVSNAITAASNAFISWQDTTPKERSNLLRNWYNLLTKHQNDLADIVTEESGKPINEARSEVNYGNSFVEFYSEEARRIDGEIISSADLTKKYLIEKHPIGVAALITPWNFPHAMITRKASAALATGCTCVIKPAEDTPLTALALAQLAKDACIPDGVINVVTCDRSNAPTVGNLLCTSPLVAGISFTGSTDVGKLLYKQCADGIKRIGLELGGNAPFIVFKSANIERAIKCAMSSKFRNCGQTCVASNRFLIQDEIYDEFVTKIVKEVEQLRIGDGKCDTNQIGPLINQAQFDKVSNLINDAISKGATVLTGAKPLTNLGPLYYTPTVLGDIKDNMKVYSEEIFGPSINLIRFKNEDEALQIANSTNRGLAGYIFTEDIQQVFRVTKHLQVGMCGVNEGLISAAEAPFGGIKESGLGREGSHHGIDDFTYIKIQQIDGGFFEKFGSLFRETVELAVRNENAEKEKVAEEAAQQIQSTTDDENQNECKIIDENSDNENVSTTSDSELDGQKDPIDFISTALNIDELYVEVLYEILHNVGCEVNYEIGQTTLFNYVQDAFKIPNYKHQQLLEIAEKKEPPEILLHVEVMEAKDLRPKDSNGLSDPFVTLYLSNNSAHRYNTSVKPATLTPVWEEHFALPISEDVTDETLCLEVWDFDPAETVKEKLGKIFDVKGVKGVRKLVKEIAVTAATGQHENELIGIAKIPLKTIPASGMTMWYSLDKKNKMNRQGVLKIRVGFSSEKNNQVAAQEHRHLLRIILLHEIEMSKVAPYWWGGTFSAQAETLLTQHIAQSGLNPIIVALCQWSVYTIIHNNHPLSFTLFSNLLDKLLKPLQIVNGFCEEDVRLFWEATKRLLPSCFSILRKIRKKNGCKDKAVIKQIVEVLNIIKKIQMLEIPNNFELFPRNLYPWLTFNDDIICDINSVINDAIIQGAVDWFNHLMENNMEQNNSDMGRLQNLIQIIQLIRSDLQKAIEFYDKLFQQCVNFQYAKALYTFYQAKISTLAEPDILNICKSLKKLQFTGNTINQNDSDRTLSEGTLLFELYLAIQRFVLLGQGLCPLDYDTFHIKNFYQWFYGGVAQWLDIAVFKALQRIEKAVELDNLIPVDTNVKYSSSAVDTLTIFYQVKVFWQQLNWPDVEGCYTFIAKIIDDICRCCVFYAGKMSDKVDGMGVDKDDKKFQVTEEWCLAINNIEYVRQSLQPFTNELGMEDVIKKISELKSPLEAQRCQHTLENVILNSIDTVRNEIIELLETVVSKMSPAMKRLLIEGAELYDQDNNSVDRLMMYVDNNLRTLHNELNEENFDRVLEIVWENLSEILNNIIQSNIEQRRPPSFFANLRKTLELMLGSFKASDQYCDNLKRTDQLLKFNGLETCDLIHQIHLDLYEKFKIIENSPYGEISIRIKFDRDNKLKIEVMNARNLIAMDSNGSCDSFIRIHLLPEEKFTGISKPKTQTHHKTQFPLYDETFVLQLSQEQRNISDGLVLFSVKDKDLLGYNNQYIGEAFIHFKDIPQTDDDISELPQIHLQLGRPSDLNTDSVKCLEQRQGDKLAKEFLRKFKQRMNPS